MQNVMTRVTGKKTSVHFWRRGDKENFFVRPRGEWRGRGRPFCPPRSSSGAAWRDARSRKGRSAARERSVCQAAGLRHLRTPQTAISHSGARRHPTGWHGRTTWWIDFRRDGAAWKNGEAWAAAAGEDIRRRDGRYDTATLTSVATESLFVQFFSFSLLPLVLRHIVISEGD